MQSEIFELSLDDEGRGQLIRLYKKLRVVFIAAIAWALISLTSNIVRLTTFRQFLRTSEGYNPQVIISYAFLFVGIILIPIQSYYYFAFSRKIKASIDEQNTMKFNNSFALLNINATLVLVSLAIHFLNILVNILGPLLLAK